MQFVKSRIRVTGRRAGVGESEVRSANCELSLRAQLLTKNHVRSSEHTLFCAHDLVNHVFLVRTETKTKFTI